MLHDFFLRDWHEQKSPSGRLHAFEHPREALVNARKYFSRSLMWRGISSSSTCGP
jgi:hypothetical protein